jgi:hypothetical protein
LVDRGKRWGWWLMMRFLAVMWPGQAGGGPGAGVLTLAAPPSRRLLARRGDRKEVSQGGVAWWLSASAGSVFIYLIVFVIIMAVIKLYGREKELTLLGRLKPLFLAVVLRDH